MKKFLKRLGIIIAALLGTALLIWLIFPNLPVYIWLKIYMLNPQAAPAADAFPDQPVPGSYHQIELNGFTFRVPESVTQDAELPDKYASDASAPDAAVLFYASDYNSLTDEAADVLTPAGMERGQRAFRGEPVQTEYDLHNLMLNVKPEDIRLTKHGVWRYIYYIFACKDSVYDGGEDTGVSRFETAQVRGFLETGHVKLMDPELKYSGMLSVYDVNDPDHWAKIVIGANDEETMQAMIHSAGIAAET